jgi:hypothetical protein
VNREPQPQARLSKKQHRLGNDRTTRQWRHTKYCRSLSKSEGPEGSLKVVVGVVSLEKRISTLLEYKTFAEGR